jgi:hypothetical protein
MRPIDLARLVWTNLTRTRFRAALSAFGVVIGTAAIVILFSLATGLQRVAAENLGGLGVGGGAADCGARGCAREPGRCHAGADQGPGDLP